MNFKINFANTIWWWQFECSKEWTPDSVVRLDCDINIKSIHEEELAFKGAGSFIICCHPN